MKVLVDDRRTGKTTKLVQWLLEGEPRSNYPGWSRIIVCASNSRVVHTTDMVKRATQEEWNQVQSSAGLRRYRVLSDIRRAVWSLDDLRQNSFGGRMEVFEYSLDDAEEFLRMVLRVHKAPECVTINGEVWPT